MRELCQIFDISPPGEERGKTRHSIVLPVNSDPITDTETGRTARLRTTGQISILHSVSGLRSVFHKHLILGQHLSVAAFVQVMS